MQNEIDLFPCGEHKEQQGFFERLLKSKNLCAFLVASVAYGSYLYNKRDYTKKTINKADITEATNNGNYNLKTIELLYDDDEFGQFWKNNNNENIGMSNPKITNFNEVTYFTINKINNDGSVERYEGQKSGGDYCISDKMIAAEPCSIEFINPYTNNKDSMTVLIEKGHTWQELKLLTKLLSMAAETKISYDKMKEACSLQGRTIYSSLKSRSDNNRLGFYGQTIGLVYADLKYIFESDKYKEDGKNITTDRNIFFEAFSTLCHEIGHIKLAFSKKYFEKSPVIESWARISAFLAEKEYIKNNPEFKLTLDSSFVSIVFEANKNQNLSSSNMMKILMLGDLHISSLARGYGFDMGDETVFNNDMELLKAFVLKGLDINELRGLNFSEEDTSDFLKKRLEVLSSAFEYQGGAVARDDYPDIYATITDQSTGKKVIINVCHILNPDKSGVKNLSGLGVNKKTRFDEILQIQKERN